jgi:hypothetical protein
VSIRDIAHALSLLCRFSGHTQMFYSVAEHSLLMSQYFYYDRALAFEALLHDASEAYCCDVIRPLKNHLPEYAEIELRNQLTIRNKFGLPLKESRMVKAIDDTIVLYELNALTRCEVDYDTMQNLDYPMNPVFLGLDPAHAEAQFLERFRSLGGIDERPSEHIYAPGKSCDSAHADPTEAR